jgi:hypothetical protein
MPRTRSAEIVSEVKYIATFILPYLISQNHKPKVSDKLISTTDSILERENNHAP